jgi:integrase
LTVPQDAAVLPIKEDSTALGGVARHSTIVNGFLLTKGHLFSTPRDSALLRIDSLIVDYLHENVLRDNDPATIDGYRATLADFSAFVARTAPLTFSDAAAGWIADRRKRVAETTMGSSLGAFRTFVNWLRKRKLVPDSLRIKVKIVRGAPRAVALEDISRAAAAAAPHTRLLMAFLLDTSLRISEAISVTTEAFDRTEPVVYVPRTKGRKPRVVAMGPDVHALCLERAAAIKPGARLFPHHRRTYFERIRAAGDAVGIKLMPHSFRHSVLAPVFPDSPDA